MAERRFVILRVIGKVPAMAGCKGCGRKFFTPHAFVHDEVGALAYLLDKFDRHECEPKINKPRTTHS